MVSLVLAFQDKDGCAIISLCTTQVSHLCDIDPPNSPAADLVVHLMCGHLRATELEYLLGIICQEYLLETLFYHHTALDDFTNIFEDEGGHE
jgi:hypothetical protein